MKKMMICFICTILTGCLFPFDNKIRDLNVNYISTEYIKDGEFITLLESNKNLEELYKQNYIENKITKTYDAFECNTELEELTRESHVDKTFLYGLLTLKNKKYNKFIYLVKYSARRGSQGITPKEYMDTETKNTDRLYCQYMVRFYFSKPFKSNIFEINLKDFLQPKTEK